MMPPYRWTATPRALRDLTSIHDDLTRASSADVASSVVQRVVDALDDLTVTPNRNIVDPQPKSRRPPVRSMPVPPYVIYFRVYDGDRIVRVSRIRHGARQPLRRFD